MCTHQSSWGTGEILLYQSDQPAKRLCSPEARYDKMAAEPRYGEVSPSHFACYTVFSQFPRVLTMEARSQRPKRQDGFFSALNVAIEALDLAKEISCVSPAKAVFGSAIVLLTMIKAR